MISPGSSTPKRCKIPPTSDVPLRCMPTTNNRGGLDTEKAAGWGNANPHGPLAFRSPERLGWPWRRLRLPHFLGLGTQKGGTTSLQKLLEQHPGVYLPPCKEVHYFSLHAQQPASWYAAHYGEARRSQRRGEITPYYLFHPQAPERIRALLPKAKLIVMLRDPVERALSQVFHARRHGFESLEVADALAAEPQRLASGDPFSAQKHSYVARSRYLEQLDRYESLFPRRQLLVLKSEDLFQDTGDVWERIQFFLKLRPIPLPMALPKANAGSGESAQVTAAVRDQLREALSTTAAGVKQRYGIDWDWS